MDGLIPVAVSLCFGRAYRYRRGRHYAPLFVVSHGRTATEFVCYVGLDGKDKGKHFVCELGDWDLRFTLVAETVAQRLPRKVAGAFTSGSGV